MSYGKRSGNNTQVEMIGITDPVKVSWKPMVKDYLKLHNPDNRRLVGGIYVSHRLVTEAESAPRLRVATVYIISIVRYRTSICMHMYAYLIRYNDVSMEISGLF